jgi:hypothetical protein
VEEKSYNIKADIYSLGTVVYKMLIGDYPYRLGFAGEVSNEAK